MNARNIHRLVIAVLMMMTSTIPACVPATAPDCTDADIFCVGLVTDGDDIRDRAINQSAWEGISQAESENIADWVEYIETTDVREYGKNIAVFAEAGYDVIVTVSSAMSDATIAAANTYPDVLFVGVDQFQVWAADEDPENDIPNLVGITFPEEQAGFLMGALAAMMTSTGQIGAVCSTDFYPPVWRYCEGYREGAAYINPEILVDVSYHNDVQVSDAFSDPVWGAETARAMVDQGVDIVFGAGGETANSAIVAAVQRGAFGLGADYDQYNLLVEASPRLLSSGIKLIAPAVTTLLRKIKTALMVSDNLPAGNFQGQVDYAPFHDLDDAVPEEVNTRLAEIQSGLLNGEIEISIPTSNLGP